MTTKLGPQGPHPYAGRMYNSAAQTHNSGTATFDVLLFDTVSFDTSESGTLVDTTNDRINALWTGLYRIRVHCEFTANSAGNRREIQLVNQSATVLSNENFQNPVNIAMGLFCQWTGFLEAGGWVEGQCFQNSGANLAMTAGEAIAWMDVLYLGP